MATYNDLPTDLTTNVFTYLRQERRQPPHAYCIDMLIQNIDGLILYDELTLEGENVIYGNDELSDHVGLYTGNAVEMAFFYPYIEEHGWDEMDNTFSNYTEPQVLSWTYDTGNMTRKYYRYDKTGTLNFFGK
jgi:hypothetical protein